MDEALDILESHHGPVLGVSLDGVVEEGEGLVEGQPGEQGGEDGLADPAHLLVAASRENDQLLEDAGREVGEPRDGLSLGQRHLQGGQSGQVLAHSPVLQAGQDLPGQQQHSLASRLSYLYNPPQPQLNIVFRARLLCRNCIPLILRFAVFCSL